MHHACSAGAPSFVLAQGTRQLVNVASRQHHVCAQQATSNQDWASTSLTLHQGMNRLAQLGPREARRRTRSTVHTNRMQLHWCAQTVEVMDAGSSAPTHPFADTAAAAAETSMRSRPQRHTSPCCRYECKRIAPACTSARACSRNCWSIEQFIAWCMWESGHKETRMFALKNIPNGQLHKERKSRSCGLAYIGRNCIRLYRQ
jgi:hypothetical protein